ncbi:S-adenosyl-L-methionine-dependent methyltransferase [Xylogone sp. PMI_703]|nr:S-adenosyl-L-methionine-dependent methyltransferase [Xylogone sp. PMI_703]
MPTSEDVIFIDDEDDQSSSNRLYGQTILPFEYIDLDDADSPIPIQDPHGDEVIDLEDIDVESKDEKLDHSCRRLVANQQDNLPSSIRNPPILPPWLEIECYKWHDYSLRRGKTVELRDGSFLHIRTIIRNKVTESIILKGWKLLRTLTLDGLLLKKLNELCFLQEVDLDDPRPAGEQSINDVKLEDVLRFRKLIKTNKLFPAHRFDISNVQHILSPCQRKNYIRENNVLVVRWKYTTIYQTGYERINSHRNKYRSKQLESLQDHECTPGYAESSEAQLLAWRNESPKDGSVEPRTCLVCEQQYHNICSMQKHAYRVDARLSQHGAEKSRTKHVPSVSTTKREPAHKKAVNINSNSRQRYTFGDIFCGAGGMTRGADMAGLDVKFGLDFDPNPMETWELNFPNATPYNCDTQEFVALPPELSPKPVAVLHLSPPCQYFSPVHTRPGKNDEMNFASLYAVCSLLKKLRPRIVTLEQTFGIHDLGKFQDAFSALIHMFTSIGFSVSWQVLSFEKFGLAQRRKRLIIVAAAPGETLPSLPEYTHGDNGEGQLMPYTSVRSVLNSVPLRAPNHDIQAALKEGLVSWDASGIVNCITCNGGERRSHPDGHRLLTAREIAALQGFPHDHEFRGKDIKRQIGNAVPPCEIF